MTREIGFLCSQYKQSMALKVFLIASLQLLTVLGIKTQNDLLAAFRKKHSIAEEIEKVSADETTTSHGQSIVINNILARVLPSRIAVSDADAVENIMIITTHLQGEEVQRVSPDILSRLFTNLEEYKENDKPSKKNNSPRRPK